MRLPNDILETSAHGDGALCEIYVAIQDRPSSAEQTFACDAQNHSKEWSFAAVRV
jgi:hypothetical protein